MFTFIQMFGYMIFDDLVKKSNLKNLSFAIRLVYSEIFRIIKYSYGTCPICLFFVDLKYQLCVILWTRKILHPQPFELIRSDLYLGIRHDISVLLSSDWAWWSTDGSRTATISYTSRYIRRSADKTIGVTVIHVRTTYLRPRRERARIMV